MKWFPHFLKTRSRPSETHSLPFNSSLQEAGHLKALRAAAGWAHYQALLERVAQAEYERLATALPYEEYLAQCGAYQAARRAVDLVDTIIEKAERIETDGRHESESGRDHARSIFFGSPQWKP
jgi:hypothetical protein